MKLMRIMKQERRGNRLPGAFENTNVVGPFVGRRVGNVELAHASFKCLERVETHHMHPFGKFLVQGFEVWDAVFI